MVSHLKWFLISIKYGASLSKERQDNSDWPVQRRGIRCSQSNGLRVRLFVFIHYIHS